MNEPRTTCQGSGEANQREVGVVEEEGAAEGSEEGQRRWVMMLAMQVMVRGEGVEWGRIRDGVQGRCEVGGR